MKKRAPVGASLIVLSSLVYASYGVWITYMGNGFGSFLQAAIRAFLVVLLLLPVAIWRKELVRVRWHKDMWWLLGLAFSSALIAGPLYYAVLQIGIGLATGVAYAGIVLGSFFFGRVIGGEKYTKDKWLATILGLSGICLVFIPHSTSHITLGIIAALISGLGSGLNLVVNKYIKYSASQTAILTWSSTIIVCLPIALLLSQHVPPLNNHHWYFLMIYTLASVVASYALIYGVKLIEAGAASILGLLEIVFGILYGLLIFSQKINSLSLCGLGIILIAAAIPYYQEFSKNKLSSHSI